MATAGSEEILLSAGFEPSDDGEMIELSSTSPETLRRVAGALRALQEHHGAGSAATTPAPGSAAGSAVGTAAGGSEGVPTPRGSPPPAGLAREASPLGTAAAAPVQALGVSPAAWQAENAGKAAVVVGGVSVSAPAPASRQPSAGASAAAAVAAEPAEADPDAFTGRNTKVRALQFTPSARRAQLPPSLEASGDCCAPSCASASARAVRQGPSVCVQRCSNVPCCMQVLLPMSPDIEVADEVFKRSPAELQRDFRRQREKREQSETLMTKAMREKLASKGRKKHLFAQLRVRFPEGLTLQGARLSPTVRSLVLHMAANPGCAHAVRTVQYLSASSARR